MNNPILGIDTWEGQLEINEATLKANGVAFMFIRLNNISGGHHKDTNFDKQWGEASGFLRAPYFVYNPWVPGSSNFLWLQSNMPADAKAVALDIEVIMPDYSTIVYAAEVKKFFDLCKAKWHSIIYTGEWFLPYLSAWPTDAYYWWAQYPLAFYPTNPLTLTWDELRTKLLPFTQPANASKVPGQLKCWQFSGDKLILPGNSHVMDVNVWLGTQAELETFMGGTIAPPPPADVITTPHDGMTHVSGVKNGWPWHLMVTDPAKVRYELVGTPALETVPSVVSRKGATFGSNAGEWNDYDKTRIDYLKPEDYTVSNGTQIMARHEAVPSFMVLNDNSIVLDHKPTANVKQAFSGLRYLIENGVIDTRLYGTEAKYTEGHTRLIAGCNAAGHAMFLLSEGAFPNQGLRLFECAEIMKQYGCVVCSDFGGGGDGGGILDGVDLIKPENINPDNGQNFYRRLPMTFLIFAKENPMATTLGTAIEKLNKIPKYRTSPHISVLPEADNWTGETIPAGSQISFDAIVDDDKHPGLPNYKWFHTPKGYTAYKYPLSDPLANPERFTILSMPVTDPPAVSPVTIVTQETNYVEKTLTIRRTREDGTVSETIDPIG